MKNANLASPKLYCRDPNWIPLVTYSDVEEKLFKFKEVIINETTNKFLH